MPDRRITEDMVTRASEVLWAEADPPCEHGDEERNRDLVRRALEEALVNPVGAQVVTEYGTDMSGGIHLWDTAPLIERVAPLAQRIEAARASGFRVRRRTVIVVDDWTEVTGPET